MNTECSKELKRLVPLSSVVRASIIDTYGDIGKTEELYSHWASRGLKKLLSESLRIGSRKVFLHVNHNTKTATLPLDFRDDTFVGIENEHGLKESLLPNANIIDRLNTVDEPCVDQCPRCQQPKTICEDLEITESEQDVVINATTYKQITVKKLYPNGDYKLITTTPLWDTQTSTIIYNTTEEVIAHLDLKVCGCLETTPENIEKVKCCCGEVYTNYYAGCCGCSGKYGRYKIFPDSGHIQFDPQFPFDKIYMEYSAFMPKIKGDYQVPEVAFETLVNWTKFKSIENRKGESNSDRQWFWQRYMIEKGNMEKKLGRASLATIIAAAVLTPKFD